VTGEPAADDTAALKERIARRFRGQAQGCDKLGSPLYAHLLVQAASDIEAGGPVWELVEPHAHDPGGSMLALRLMGATHRLALNGQAPELAAHYPSAGGDGDAERAWDAWYRLVKGQPDVVAALIPRPVQTNEVGRAAALLAGFLTVARETGLPLRLLEIGTSAGLNLRWDQFRYTSDGRSWGPAASPVLLGVGGAVRFEPATVEIAERAGCDLHPVDVTTEDGRLTLLSFVWPDQTARFANLAGACDLAAQYPVAIDRSAADAWLRSRLAAPLEGTATVVFHSVFWQYVDADGRASITDAIETAGAAATTSSPLAWLRLEPVTTLDSDMEVRLRSWPGGRDERGRDERGRDERGHDDEGAGGERRLGVAHPHGTWVRWF
jgi:hypothetical protein